MKKRADTRGRLSAASSRALGGCRGHRLGATAHESEKAFAASATLAHTRTAIARPSRFVTCTERAADTMAIHLRPEVRPVNARSIC